MLGKIEGVRADYASWTEGGYEKLAFSTNTSLYFENDKRYGHSYGRRI